MRWFIGCREAAMLIGILFPFTGLASAQSFDERDYAAERDPRGAATPGQAMRHSAVAPASDIQSSPSVRSATSPKNPGAIPLTPQKNAEPNAAQPKPQTPARALTTVFGSLAIVLGLFVLVVWFTKRALPKAATSLPTEVVDILGRTPIGKNHQLQMVRVGKKLLLLSVTANGATTLTEISDQDETDRLAGLCQQNQSGSISNSFRQVISQLGSERRGRSADDEQSVDGERESRPSRTSGRRGMFRRATT